jgi:hypothetical protein
VSHDFALALVLWEVDNGSSHNRDSIERMSEAWPNAVLVHLPVHASWLNQVEMYFSILQRKAITGGDFKNLGELAERILPSRTATTPPPNPSTANAPAPASTNTCAATPNMRT